MKKIWPNFFARCVADRCRPLGDTLRAMPAGRYDLAATTLFLLAPLFAVAAMGGHWAALRLEDRLQQDTKARALQFRRQVESTTQAFFAQKLGTVLESNLAHLQTLHQQTLAGALSLKDAQKLALESLAEQPVGRHSVLFVLNQQGTLLGRLDQTLASALVMPQFLEQLQALKPQEQGVYHGTLPKLADNARPAALLKQVFTPWNWTVGLLCAENNQTLALPSEAVNALINANRGTDGLQPFVLDQEGHFLPTTAWPDAAAPANRETLNDLVTTLRGYRQGLISWQLAMADQPMDEIAFAFQTVETGQLTVGFFGSARTLYQPLNTFRSHFFTSLGLLFLAAFAMTAVLCRHRNAALRHLATSLKQAGDRDEVVPFTARSRELETIAQAHNQLIATLRQSAAQVHGTQLDTERLNHRLLHLAKDAQELQLKLQAETATRMSAEKYLLLFKGIFDNAIEGIFITDHQQCILSVNPSFTRITGYLPAEVIGQAPRMFGAGQPAKNTSSQIWQDLRQQDFWSGEMWAQNKKGTVCPLWLSVSVIKNARQEITHYFAFFHDITELKRKEKQIAVMAYSDALTQLPNRTALELRLRKAITRATREELSLAIFFIDLDNFKNINDSLGHHSGDRVLVEVAARLAKITRNEDTLSRLGGDEFILLSECIDNPNAVLFLANRILATLQQPISLPPHTIYINASIGISLFPNDGRTSQELIKNADLAMYKAKSEGKNKFVLFTQEMNDRLLYRVKMENAIRSGLKKKEFSVFYQPKIDLQHQRPTSFEALVRWQRNGMIVGPDEFIPIAEDSGLIDEMSLYVLDEVCLFLSRLQNNRLRRLPVSVNMSPKTFNNKTLVTTIDNMLADHGVDHRLIEFEITETTAMRDVRYTLDTMRQFRQRGIRFSIDDFGTGYSSLSYLSEMPVSTIKIDKRFISADDANSRSIVATITAMSKQMQLKVVAEGVETSDQVQWLQQIGCDEVQGFFFSRPLPEQKALLYLHGGVNTGSVSVH